MTASVEYVIPIVSCNFHSFKKRKSQISVSSPNMFPLLWEFPTVQLRGFSFSPHLLIVLKSQSLNARVIPKPSSPFVSHHKRPSRRSNTSENVTLRTPFYTSSPGSKYRRGGRKYTKAARSLRSSIRAAMFSFLTTFEPLMRLKNISHKPDTRAALFRFVSLNRALD